MTLIAPVRERLSGSWKKSEIELLDRAFDRASSAHQGQLRKSGDPYITHPVAVAEILVELGLCCDDLCRTTS